MRRSSSTINNDYDYNVQNMRRSTTSKDDIKMNHISIIINNRE